MSSEAEAMRELNALRDAIAQKKELKVTDDAVMLGAVKFARKVKTPIRTKKGFAELDTLVMIALHPTATVAQYISACAQAKVTTLDFFEKPLISDYLTGKATSKVVIDTAGLLAERLSAPAPAAAEAVDTDRPTKKQRTEQGEIVSLTTTGAFTFEDAARLEVAAHTRSSILQAQTATAAGAPAGAAAAAAAPRTLQSVLAVFDASRKGAVDGAAAASSASASASGKPSRSDSKHSRSHSHSKTSGSTSASAAHAHAHAGKKRAHGGDHKMKPEDMIPIILVPDAVSSLITMLNAKEFFSHSNFTPSASTTAKAGAAAAAAAAGSSSSSSAAGGGGGGKQDVVVIERPSLRDPSRVVRYHVMDSTSKLNAAKAWRRVVAVFAHGAKWQFTGYPWDTPAQIFDNIAGYHLHFDDEPLNPNIKDWKITKLKISKTKRYQDRSTLMEFWQSLGDFISAHPTKKHLSY